MAVGFCTLFGDKMNKIDRSGIVLKTGDFLSSSQRVDVFEAVFLLYQATALMLKCKKTLMTVCLIVGFSRVTQEPHTLPSGILMNERLTQKIH